VAVKVSPFYTCFAHFAARLAEAGADGLVMFNRFFEPDVDTEELEVVPYLIPSDSSKLLLRLRWLAILSGRLDVSLAATGGVHTPLDALKAVMCGADAVQVVSAVLRNSPRHLDTLRQGMCDWLEEKEYDSLSQARGSMNLLRCPDPSAFQRANYMRLLLTWQP
jgi:dihydroorotate dehydrogenase (fumarate)